MTNPNQLQPGPELDALIAEKVMGGILRREDGSTIVKIGHVEYSLNDWDINESEYNPFSKTYPLFLPSTSISEAWEVVEKMHSEGYFYTIKNRTVKGSCTDSGYSVVFFKAGNSEYRENIRVMDTISHAICLAALKAIGE